MRKYISPELDLIYHNKDALIVLLRCIQFLRGFKIPKELKQRTSKKTLTDWDSNFWLDISYFDAAQVAQYCGAHLTSILFLEIVAAQQVEDSETDAYNLPEGNVAEQPGVQQKKDLEKLFFKGFTAIGEYDGVLGTGFARFSDFQSHIQYLQDSQCWDQVLAILDSQGSGNELGICSAMINMGRYQTCWNFLAGVEATSGRLDNKLSGVHHECAWRLSRWDLDDNKVDYFVQDIEGITNAPLHKFVYESMKCSVKGDNVQFHTSLKISLGAIAEDLRHSSLESSSNLYEFLMKFQLIRVIEDLHNACQDKNLHEACEKWKLQYSFPSPDFRYQEPILTATQVLLRQFLETRNMRGEVVHDTNEIIFDMISKARDSGRLELAEKYVHLLNGNCDAAYQKEMEIAKNYWWREQHDIARQKLTFLLDHVPEDHVLYPRLLLLLGEWKLRNSVERPSSIFCNCFRKVERLYDTKISANMEEERADAYKTIAVYADGQYKNVAEYLKGKSFEDKKTLLEKMREEKALLEKKGPSDTLNKLDRQKYHKHLITLKKNIEMDEKDISGTKSEKVTYQSYALELYLKAIKTSNRHDLFIFRVTALWLSKIENEKPPVHPTPPDMVMKSIKLPSHKFIPVIHQLSARLSDLKGATLTELQIILTNCAKEHPYHTLPVLLTQSLLNADKKFTGEASKSTSQALSLAALNLLKGMRSSNIEILIHKMNSFWVKLIELAYQHDKDKDGRPKDVVGKLSNIKFELTDLQDLPVPTIPLPVLVNREYSSKLIKIQSIENQYYYVGGVNFPKRIVCRASDGKSYNMLLKGNDDLRQDSVMQQVFGVMNQLLESEKRTRRKRLLMRTYKVVALSQCSGIIEWCENTQTFGEYLIGRDHACGAHVVYRPKDWTPARCRKAMIEVKDSGDASKKLTVYQQIIKNFKPVFRHFFFENFKDPGEFFERRLAYTRSVATSSIVGYVVGLGDRHCQNILIDKNTAEVIHIDLGVAFEQGLILPTPETIPFRLTRDVVDGMGFCGTEGVYKIACENTLEVLRKDADIILTILEVLLYDPLYFWLLSEDRKKKVQPDNSGPKFHKTVKTMLPVEPVNNMEQQETTENSAAARELTKVRCKLAGIYESVSHSPNMTVPGHVAQLINHAQEIGKLACLFHGWQPYL